MFWTKKTSLNRVSKMKCFYAPCNTVSLLDNYVFLRMLIVVKICRLSEAAQLSSTCCLHC